MAAALDQQIELVAGCFSQDPQNTKITGQQLYLDPSRCYPTYQEMAATEAKLPDDQRIDFVSIVTPNNLHFPIAKIFIEADFHVVCDNAPDRPAKWPVSGPASRGEPSESPASTRR